LTQSVKVVTQYQKGDPRQRKRRYLLVDGGSDVLDGDDGFHRVDDSEVGDCAQTTLRKVVGQHTLDEALSETDVINDNIQKILDVATLEWGVEVNLVELKDIQLPESMKRAMARQAEAEREKRTKIIAAEGESMAAAALGHASDTMMAHPLARTRVSADHPPRCATRRQSIDTGSST
jgi:regulator of protease activity HflC (stomatin/prohibitin superfamily)